MQRSHSKRLLAKSSLQGHENVIKRPLERTYSHSPIQARARAILTLSEHEFRMIQIKHNFCWHKTFSITLKYDYGANARIFKLTVRWSVFLHHHATACMSIKSVLAFCQLMVGGHNHKTLYQLYRKYQNVVRWRNLLRKPMCIHEPSSLFFYSSPRCTTGKSLNDDLQCQHTCVQENFRL